MSLVEVVVGYDTDPEVVATAKGFAESIGMYAVETKDRSRFGDMKVTSLGSVLAKRFGVAAAGELVPDHMTLGDVDSAEALAEYQARKRAHKKSLKDKTGQVTAGDPAA